MVCIGAGAVLSIPLNVKAKSLEDSFYSGASIFPDGYEKSHKECWAGTDGYYGMHYIRAMVGKGDECMADTGRCYDNGNIKFKGVECCRQQHPRVEIQQGLAINIVTPFSYS